MLACGGSGTVNKSICEGEETGGAEQTHSSSDSVASETGNDSCGGEVEEDSLDSKEVTEKSQSSVNQGMSMP